MSNPALDSPERIYGLLGAQLGHSFSPGYFAAKFRQLGLAARYLRFERPELGELRSLLHDHPGLRGLNVTIPYKRAVMPQLDALAPTAAATGAVNCIVITTEGRWVGHNTDAEGFAVALEAFLAGEACPDALVLGTGGAAAAVHYALSQRPERPQVLSVSRRAQQGSITYDELSPDRIARHRLIVNTTPLGMHPDVTGAPPLPYHLLTPAHRLVDLVYNPAETRFMQLGADRGARGCNGLDMLYAQAEAGWTLWQDDWNRTTGV